MGRDIRPSIEDPVIRAKIINVIKSVWSMFSVERETVKNSAKLKIYQTKKDGTQSLKYNVLFTCAECGKAEAKVDVDHVSATGQYPSWPPNGDGSWDRWLLAQFSPIENLQVLCRPCHRRKSAEEKRTGAYKK